MARFARGDAHLELVQGGRTVIEGSAFGEARVELEDERAARIAYYRRIGELLEDRWSRTSAFADDVIADALPFAVDDADALAVYTDWLIERGDPRGELAALRAAEVPDARAIASLEKTRGLELFGPFAFLPRAWREHVAFGWQHGWIDEIVLRHVDGALVQPGELMHAALHAPMSRFARWLTVDRFYAQTIHEGIAPCSCTDRIAGLRIADGGAYEQVLGALPALEELELLDSDFVTGGHARVRRIRLTIDHGVPEITGEFPSLQRLDLVVRSVIGTMRGMLQLLERPTLREVTIEAPEIFAPVMERIEVLRERMDIRITLRPED